MAAEVLPLLITGGTGRIGRVLRGQWPWAFPGGLRPIWVARDGRPGCLHWNMGDGPCPDPWAGGVVLGLAGGRTPDLRDNTALALATLRVAAAQGARHVFLASSMAVYGPGMGLTEDAAPAPVTDYGVAKARMEEAALAAPDGTGPGLTILRIGNIAGLDALLGRRGVAAGRGDAGPVILDPVPGQEGGPQRAYVGPATLAAVLARLAVLAAEGAALPRILNIAAPQPVAMADLLRAAALPWEWGPANPGVVPAVTLDTGRLQALVRLPPPASTAAWMVREWRSLGAAWPAA